MKIKIVSLIRRQEQALQVLEQDYMARIRKFLPCELIEIKREPIVEGRDRGKIFRAEIKKVETHLKDHSVLVVLDSEGRQYNSHDLARWLEERIREGQREIVFVAEVLWGWRRSSRGRRAGRFRLPGSPSRISSPA